MFEIIILSAIQGITEFLPISSSAHLILVSKFLSFSSENLTLDISLHLGSLLAVIIFFKNEILNFIQNRSLFIKIFIGSLPTIVVGFLLVKFNLFDQLRSTYFIALSTILFGVLLYLSDKSPTKKNLINNLSFKESIFIGLLQILSLIPGVSRSGVTLTGARFLKYTRVESAKISFLFSIPTLVAVSSYGIIKVTELKSIQLTVNNIWAIALSFIFSLATLKIFINFIKKFTLIFFVIYRIILGIIILLYVYV